jgi:hypothetical protein
MNDISNVPTATSEKVVVIQNQRVPVGIFTHGPRLRAGSPEERVLKPYELDEVTILGMGLSAWDFIHMSYGNPTHFGNPKHQVWTLNYGAYVFRSDLCFNLHDFGDGDAHGGNFRAYAHVPDTKIVSVRAYDWLPNSYEYPLHEVLEDGMCGVPYLKNTTAYAIAFAILCRVKKINLFGADFDYDPRTVEAGEKFERGRANVEFWLGRATAYGIDVSVAPSSTLLGAAEIAHEKTIRFYGYEDTLRPEWSLEGNQGRFIGFTKSPSFTEMQAQIVGEVDPPNGPS